MGGRQPDPDLPAPPPCGGSGVADDGSDGLRKGGGNPPPPTNPKKGIQMKVYPPKVIKAAVAAHEETLLGKIVTLMGRELTEEELDTIKDSIYMIKMDSREWGEARVYKRHNLVTEYHED